MNYIVYETTNKRSGKYYIGVHEQMNDPWNEDGYYGSGAILKNINTNLLFRETLFVYDNKEDAYKKEAEIVTEQFIKNSNCYNILLGGHGGWTIKESRLGNIALNNIMKNDPVRWQQIRNARRLGQEKYYRTNPGPVKGKYIKGCQVVAGNFLFKSYKDAARFYNISDNGIRRRVQSKKVGYYIIHDSFSCHK